jgi:hypothetical protein
MSKRFSMKDLHAFMSTLEKVFFSKSKRKLSWFKELNLKNKSSQNFYLQFCFTVSIYETFLVTAYKAQDLA